MKKVSLSKKGGGLGIVQLQRIQVGGKNLIMKKTSRIKPISDQGEKGGAIIRFSQGEKERGYQSSGAKRPHLAKRSSPWTKGGGFVTGNQS